jgi:shikimate dehydrogenase
MYYLIGKKIGYSYSPYIHKNLGLYNYQVKEMNDISSLLSLKEFNGLNVTIPFKEEVVKYLDYLDPIVEEIGVCNTIVNNKGKLYGYNTDYAGFKYLLSKNNIVIKDKTCYILGSGATSKTIKLVLKELGAKKIVTVSRAKKGLDFLNYQDLKNDYYCEVLINTTPVGVYPDFDKSVVGLKGFKKVETVIDVNYNPFRTKLLLEADSLGLKNYNGLEMLIYQAKVASELFQKKKIGDEIVQKIKKNLLFTRRNIVFIGMPGTGKTTIAKFVAQEYGKKVYDIDKEVSKSEDMSITDLFKEKGEDYFRQKENEKIRELALKRGIVISTGGGVVLEPKNMSLLQANGLIVFLNRDLKNIYLRKGKRPLIQSKADLVKIKEERIGLYYKYKDLEVQNNYSIKESVKKVIKSLSDYRED